MDLFNATRSTAKAFSPSQKQKSWNAALRFITLLIQAIVFEYLKEYVPQVLCRKNKGFLCGIFAQLEGSCA